jgi:hypothetical protein
MIPPLKRNQGVERLEEFPKRISMKTDEKGLMKSSALVSPLSRPIAVSLEPLKGIKSKF